MARNLPTPLRAFLRTETGGAAVLFAAVAAALIWVNVDVRSYHSVWSTQLSIHLGGSDVSLDLRGWVNSGLMTLFFFVIGLEARREFDLGELRERRRIALPVLAGLGGSVASVGVYLALNAGSPSAHGWGTAMSTDTAFAARSTRGRRAASSGSATRIPAHRRRRRQPDRAPRDRPCLHGTHRRRAADRGDPLLRRRGRHPLARHPPRPPLISSSARASGLPC
jgi:hypothetical protein